VRLAHHHGVAPRQSYAHVGKPRARTAPIPAISRQVGAALTRLFADAGYRGHNAPRGAGLRVYALGQKPGVTDQIKRELRRRAAVQPVIGHLKEEHRMGRNHLTGRAGDAINASSPLSAITSSSSSPGSHLWCVALDAPDQAPRLGTR
jgi:hypothetical protein